MILVVVIVAGVLMVVGLLIGWSLAEMAFSQRSRRQARLQRRLNAERQALRDSGELARLARFFEDES
jgi:uncharacterized membrane-anchored protein YhcB (DUF1043 family)